MLKSAIRKIPSNNAIALTYDDGPHGITTPCVLDALKEHDLCATFFVLGENCEEHTDLVFRILNDGHQIGLHGYTHFRHIGKRTTIGESLDRSIEVLTNITGIVPELFRPPYGWWLPKYKDLLEERGLTLVLWSLMMDDYRRAGSTSRFHSMLQRSLKPADIVVLHDNARTTISASQNTRILANKLAELQLKTSFIRAI